jgi:hypothetical protein
MPKDRMVTNSSPEAPSTAWLAAAAAAHFRAARESLHDHGDDAITRLLASLELDKPRHLVAPPSSARELASLEAALGVSLPAEFRELLGRFGGALLYDRHEVFGPFRVLVHDIEMVPDLLSIRARLRREGCLPAHLIPFHRADGVIHALDMAAAGSRTTQVVGLEDNAVYPSLSMFLRAVVLPPGALGR